MRVVKLVREMGLVKLGTVALGGTKLKANASRHSAVSYEGMQQAKAELKAQIDALLRRAKRSDEAEADEPKLYVPAEIEHRESRLDAIAAAHQRLEQRQREADTERGRSDDDDLRPRGGDGNPKGGRCKRVFGEPEAKAQENFTDPGSRMVKRLRGGFDPSFNAQTAVHDAVYIIVAAELGNNAADCGQLLPMLKAVKDNLGQPRHAAPARPVRCGVPQQGELRPGDEPGDGTAGGAGTRGQAVGAGRCRRLPPHGRHGRDVAARGSPCRVSPTQVDPSRPTAG